MEPTIADQQIVVASKETEDIQKGDIVLIQIDGTHYVKRVIGLPGDQVEGVRNNIYVNGKKQTMFTLKGDEETTHFLIGEVPEHSIFVIGDNLVESVDSRQIGPIPINLIKGKIIWY